jgi:3' terminal RNA ribose 2'-O-methyltransferase Hen1
MLLTITCTAPEATDLGYLLHKNPASLFEKEMTFGIARVFYPEATPECCTAALQVEVDPIGLVRGRGAGHTLAQYVSDRPYVPSSFLSVAIAECFGTALGGRSKERPSRVEEKMPLAATLHALDCDGGAPLIRGLFEPLGYAVEAERQALLDERFPDWGASDLYTVRLAGQQTVRDLLTHLNVLVPVLDNAKHYAIGEDEVEKLLRRGEGWLATHPEKDLIARRYLRYKRTLTHAALARLAEVEDASDAETTTEEGASARDAAEQTLEAPVRLNDERIKAAISAVRALDPPVRRVIDLGCGEGKTMAALLKEAPGLEHVAGMDASTVALERAARRLHLDRLSDRERARVSLFHGSLVYRDARLADYDVALLTEVNSPKPAPTGRGRGHGFDVAILTEVIEHVEPSRLPTVERVVFECARPRRVVITTPNHEYNSVWPSLPAGKFRHADHRFEWTRGEFREWAEGVAGRNGYTVTFSGIGEEDPQDRGTPTQMAVFDRDGQP